MKPQTKLQKNLGIIFGMIIVCSVLGITIFYANQSSNTAPTSTQTAVDTQNTTPTPTKNVSINSNPTPTPVTTPSPTPVVIQTPPVDTPKKSLSTYTDGTYSATGSYMSPGGYDQLAVTLTLKSDIITSVSVTPMANDGTSRRYQSRFISGYQQYVLGKNIASVNLGVISGSSLTPKGFNDALAQIKSQAKA